MMKKVSWVLVGMLGLFAITMATSQAADSRRSVKAAQSKPVIRGGIVFKNYCVLCHGQSGDGNVLASKLYGKASLKIKEADTKYYTTIIRYGGVKVGKSEFMPPWQDELSEEQINDVVAYLQVVASPVQRGEVVFKTNCILCHGVNADGKGRVAKLYDPPPANLTISDKNDDYKRMIITYGGKAMGRSDVMPVWGEQISAEEIEDVIAYLRTILKK